MNETPPTNELVESLIGRLSPEGRKVQAELDAIMDTLDPDTLEDEGEALMEQAMDRMERLPEEDRALLQQIARLKARAYEQRGEEYMGEARYFEEIAGLIDRALELERAAGRDPGEGMTLGEALEVLKAHGEAVPDLGTERVVEVPQGGGRTVPAFYPDFANPNTLKRWDGSAQAEAWARLMESREGAILASVGDIAGVGVEGTDYAGVIAFLWNLDEDEAAEFVRRRQAGL